MSDDKTPVALEPNFFELPPVNPDAETKPYWVGTLPGCPVYNVSAGGISFPRYTDPPTGTDVDSMQTQRSHSRGDIVYLTEVQVAAVRRNVKDKVVRLIGNRGQGMIHALANPNFTLEAKDQPLAMFIYMVPLDESAVMLRLQPRGAYPVSMYEMAGGKGKAVLPQRPSGPSPDIAPEIEDLDKPVEKQHTPPQLRGDRKK